uniref:NADH-ubiquinone oxidoreductase chain 6 n=1 Tax=Russelliana solanicola TaxID=2008469 RepID=A0A344A2S0_9HEMI|nr:NADH dehydrogenase subunit 6 [Russelliana solanicola]AWU49061.1 NADH dehydrogenase subunit 6 [Russelliana solanicola]
MKIILLMIMFVGSTLTSINHPLPLGFALLTQTILICLTTRVMTSSSWVPLTLFLIMVGGLMVIFMYITSICSNKKFNYLSMLMPLWYFSLPLVYLLWTTTIIQFEMNDSMHTKDLFNMEFIKMFMSLNTTSSNFMFIYLLIMLIIMINLMTIKKGPLRKKY